jgi:quercetin dioxygenase-like cupin family protein
MSEPSNVLQFPRRPRPAVQVTLWEGPGRPDELTVRAGLTAQGYQVVAWRSEPAEGFPPHVHIYPELMWLLEGSLTIILPVENRLLELLPGDRIALPAGLVHGTMAGAEGAYYLLATR